MITATYTVQWKLIGREPGLIQKSCAHLDAAIFIQTGANNMYTARLVIEQNCVLGWFIDKDTGCDAG